MCVAMADHREFSATFLSCLNLAGIMKATLIPLLVKHRQLSFMITGNGFEKKRQTGNQYTKHAQLL